MSESNKLLDETRYTYNNEDCPDKLHAMENLIYELLDDIDPSKSKRDKVLHNNGITKLLNEIKESLHVRRVTASKEKLARSIPEKNTQVKRRNGII